jgi:hypothetical protein
VISCKSSYIKAVVAITVVLILGRELGSTKVQAAPTVFPTGVTIHNVEKAFGGFTMFNFMADKAVHLIDMEGNIVNTWVHPDGARFGPMARPLSGGRIMALFGTFQDRGVGIFDWNGNLEWQYFNEDWSLNHDFQAGSTYFGADILANDEVLILSKTEADFPNIATYTMRDEIIAKVNLDGETVWSWSTAEHYDELGISTKGKEEIFDGTNRYGDKVDIFHTNSVILLPGNKHGPSDSSFSKGNVLVSQRNTSKVFIIDQLSGSIVWSLDDCSLGNHAPIGQHHASMIPRGLLGEGNILLYDNGGKAGYPEKIRFFTRVMEVNPANCNIVWEYTAVSSDLRQNAFFSRTRGSVQRLPNGNTMISEPTWLRIFEVTDDGEIVWEYIHPKGDHTPSTSGEIHSYRAYRINPNWPLIERNPEPTGKKLFGW